MKATFYKTFFVLIFTIFGTSGNAQTPNSYLKEWEKIDSLEKKGLFRMALKEVEQIFVTASSDKNHNQVIKSVLYQLRYTSYLEEDDYVLGIYKLEGLVKEVPSPSKEIFHSLLAEVYWGYYSSNSWKFTNRTEIVNANLEDVRTWDLNRIEKRIRYHYGKSLMNDSYSKSAALNDFTDIISSLHNARAIQPTLYDFLGRRALDYFRYNSASFGRKC